MILQFGLQKDFNHHSLLHLSFLKVKLSYIRQDPDNFPLLFLLLSAIYSSPFLVLARSRWYSCRELIVSFTREWVSGLEPSKSIRRSGCLRWYATTKTAPTYLSIQLQPWFNSGVVSCISSLALKPSFKTAQAIASTSSCPMVPGLHKEMWVILTSPKWFLYKRRSSQ